MDQANAILEGRTRLKMSQEVLAAAAGVSARTVIRAERGIRVSGESLRAICAVIGRDAASLAAAPAEQARDASGGPVPRQLHPWIRGMMGLRNTPVMFVTFLVLAFLSVIPPVWVINTISRLDGPARRLVEASQAVATARYLNAVAAGSSDASPPRMITEACRSDGLVRALGVFLTSAEFCAPLKREIRIERTELGQAETLFAAGPVGDGFARDVVRRLSGDPSVAWQAAIGSGRQGRDLAWFDPRTIPPPDYPRSPADGDAWLYLRLKHANMEAQP